MLVDQIDKVSCLQKTVDSSEEHEQYLKVSVQSCPIQLEVSFTLLFKSITQQMPQQDVDNFELHDLYFARSVLLQKQTSL